MHVAGFPYHLFKTRIPVTVHKIKVQLFTELYTFLNMASHCASLRSIKYSCGKSRRSKEKEIQVITVATTTRVITAVFIDHHLKNLIKIVSKR